MYYNKEGNFDNKEGNFENLFSVHSRVFSTVPGTCKKNLDNLLRYECVQVHIHMWPHMYVVHVPCMYVNSRIHVVHFGFLYNVFKI